MAELGPDAQYRAFLREGRFMIQRATSDGRAVFFPRVAAPHDGSPLEWVEASGQGVVYATTVVRKKPPEPSYNVVLVDLHEGPRMMSRVEGVPPEAVSIGMRVQARIVQTDEEPFIVFEPMEARDG